MKKKNSKAVKSIRLPKAPGILFLLFAITTLFTALGQAILPLLTELAKEYDLQDIICNFLNGTATLFLSIVLLKKVYNNSTIYATVALLISSIVSLFIKQNISASSISVLIFYIALVIFTYIMVKMPGTKIREAIAKLRCILTIYFTATLIISLIQTIRLLGESLSQRGEVTESMANATVLLPLILFVPSGIVYIVCYTLFINWLENPYEK